MSSLTERPLLISPSLAATIGLEAALVYQLISDWLPLLESQPKQGQQWYLIDMAKLADQLPFWQPEQILQVLRTLTDLGLIIMGGALMSNVKNLRIALPQNGSATGASPQEATLSDPETPSPAAAAQPSLAAPPRHSQAVPGHSVIPANWRPDRAILDFLTKINRVESSFIEAQLPEFIAHYRDSGDTRASWNSTFSQYISRRWKKAQYQQIEAARNQPIDDDWQPSIDALEILRRDHISAAFIEDAIPEFVLYWRERGTADNNWNSRFIQHIRLQWAKFTRSVPNDQEITPIPANWRPDDAVFDILRMARIDAEFAQQQIPEFILYWRDSGQPQRSWNTKFLQHVKYRWAHSHQLGQHHGKQQTSGAGPAATDFIDKHTDRSWREGL